MTTMGVDFGARRIGIAISSSGLLAAPLAVIPNRGDLDEVARSIARIASEHSVERIVLGNPSRAGDEVTIERFRSLADRIAGVTGLDVVLWNEAYSTTEAASLRRERGATSAKRRARAIDDEAAAVILQSWLDASARGAGR